MRSFLRSLTLASALALAVGGLAGCKQGEGERCQIDSDCDDGLVCSTSNSTCVREGVVIDAGPTIDSATPVEPDAAVSVPDSGATTVDSAPTPDVSLPDAAP